jgi:predicted nucleotidyltransferase component of viral defense system
MSLKDFDATVNGIIQKNPSLAGLRVVIEKEVLHHSVFEALRESSLLSKLTFQGGTALRLCHGSPRFSEDLDFAGGKKFNMNDFRLLGQSIQQKIGDRFGLQVNVKEPGKEDVPILGTVALSRWQVRVRTRPENRSLPQQMIKIEIVNVDAYSRDFVPIRNNYSELDLKSQILVPVESPDEILADKVVAFPASLADKLGQPVANDSRLIRYRDIWDIAWLIDRGAMLRPDLVQKKVNQDYMIPEFDEKLQLATTRIEDIVHRGGFRDQMNRFLGGDTLAKTLEKPKFVNSMIEKVTNTFSSTLQKISSPMQVSNWTPKI